MNRLRERLKRFDVFDALSLGLIVVLVGLALTQWSKFPKFIDIYYHMGVTKAYASSGGIALHDFWEFAPAGRAQLYPPLLHIIMYVMNKAGLSLVSVGRVVSFSAFPLILLSSWYGIKRLFSSRAAFYTTVVLSSCYAFFYTSSIQSAAALVLILTPLLFVAVERDRKIAACPLLAMALYSHLVFGHLVAFSLLIYAIHNRKRFKEIAFVLVGAYILWLPWGINIFVNRQYLSFRSAAGGGTAVAIPIIVAALAAAGFIYCYFKKGKYYLLPSFLLGTVPILFFYPDRFWDAQGFVPLAFLAGMALSAAHGFAKEKAPGFLKSRNAKKVLLTGLMAVPVAFLLLFDPVLSLGSGGGGQPARAAQARVVQAQAGTSSAPSYAMMSAPSNGTTAGATPPALPQNAGSSSALSNFTPPSGTPPTGTPPAGMTQGNPPPGAAGGPGTGAQAMMAGPGGSSGVHTRTTTLRSLMTGSAGGNDGPLINATTTKLAELIEKNSTSDQIIYASDPSLGNLMTSLTGRASTTGMFHEVASPGRSSASDASLIIVSAQGGQGAMQGGGPGAASVDTSKYKLVGKVGNYTLYRNTSATSKAGSPGTVIPWFVVFSILGLAIAGIAIDWFRPRHPGSTPPARTSHPGEGGSGTPGIVNAPGAYERKSVISIVPCFNEEGSIASVVAELRASAPDLDILVVDDGSTDRSAEIAAVTGVTVLSHGRNLGIGASLRTGMLYALDRGYRFAVQVDGDGQHDPSFTPAMMSVLESGEADVVISSRFLGTEGYKPPFLRRVGTRVLARAVKLATGVRATDTTSGFRAMNRRALSFLVDNYPEDYPESESLVLMRLGGIRWKEIPVAMRERRLGTSSVKGLVSVAYVAKVLGRITLDAVRFKAPRDPVYARVSP